MKVILLCITIVLASLSLIGCTNDEGESDLEILTPDEEKENALVLLKENEG